MCLIILEFKNLRIDHTNKYYNNYKVKSDMILFYTRFIELITTSLGCFIQKYNCN